jgi:hypothetical protein
MNPKVLLRKVARRANKYAMIASGYIPGNRKYVPIGVKSLLAPDNFRDDGSIEYLELNPPYVSRLNLDQQFISDCSDFSKPEISMPIPGDYIATLKNGRVYSYDPSNTAVITMNNYLVEELSFQWELESEALVEGRKNKVFKMRGLVKPKKFKGTVFSLLGGGGAKYYYYHWMIDSLGKLGLLKQSGRFDKVDYFLVPSYSAKYHKETLSHFGIGEDKIINEDSIRHIQADYLMVSSYTQVNFHHPKWVCDFLHNSFTLPRGEKKRETLIYIPRGDAAVNRKVLNEAELIEVLKGYGFDIRFLSEMTVPDEAEFFNSAKLVLGVQGSGFTNLVFCEPGTIVVEFFPDKYVRHIDYDICNKMGLEYHYILCPSDGEAHDTVEGQKINVIADIPAIKAKLDTLLDRTRA